MLARHFINSACATQRALIGSVILRTGPDVPLRSYERRSDTLIESSEHFSRAPYVLAFASDIQLPPFPNSAYVYRTDLDTDIPPPPPLPPPPPHIGEQLRGQKTGQRAAEPKRPPRLL